MINILRELCRNKTGRVEGVSMADMMQMIWLEKMTCRLLVKCNGNAGTLNILDGELKSAKTRTHKEQEAAMDILTWKDVTIELDEKPAPPNHIFKVSTEEMLLENIRRREDKKEDTGKFTITHEKRQKNKSSKDVFAITIKNHLVVFSDVTGYLGSGVFTLQGEMLAGSTEISGIRFETAGCLINDMLLMAEKISESSGFGNCDMIQLDTEMGIILAKCLNDGKTRYHAIMIIKKDGNVTTAKMKLNKLADRFQPEP